MFSISPTQINLFRTIKKILSPVTGYFGYKDELLNHHYTFNISFTPVCVLRTGAFCFPLNFFQKIFNPVGIILPSGTEGHERGSHHPLSRLRKEVKP